MNKYSKKISLFKYKKYNLINIIEKLNPDNKIPQTDILIII